MDLKPIYENTYYGGYAYDDRIYGMAEGNPFGGSAPIKFYVYSHPAHEGLVPLYLVEMDAGSNKKYRFVTTKYPSAGGGFDFDTGVGDISIGGGSGNNLGTPVTEINPGGNNTYSGFENLGIIGYVFTI